jgi:hypothetical protein
MAYLSNDDYTLAIGLENLTEILTQASETSGRTPDQVRQFAEAYARAYVSSFLKVKYQIDGEYSKDSSDTGRDMLIVAVTIDLTLCTLHKTINPRDIPELRQKACEAAILWLKDVMNGDALISVPRLTTGEQVNTFLGSQQKFISKPYTDGSLNDIPANMLPFIYP